MQFKIPKNTEKYKWTRHSIFKMKQHRLTAQRVLRVIRNPQRKEEGIVKNTIAVMQPASTRFVRSSSTRLDSARQERGGHASTQTKNGKKVWSSEIWAMYKLSGKASPKSQIPNSKKPNPHPVPPGGTTFSLSGREDAGRKLIISAWRYPGVSPKNNPVPEEIIRELEEIG